MMDVNLTNGKIFTQINPDGEIMWYASFSKYKNPSHHPKLQHKQAIPG